MLVTIIGVVTLLTPTGLRAAWKDGKDSTVIVGRQTLPSATSLFRPNDVAVSAGGKVYVVDNSYHRVLRYGSAAALGNGQAAEAVFGQPNLQSATPGTTQSSLDSPISVTIDNSGNLWVSDTENGRVLRWANADSAASGEAAAQVLGHADFTTRGPEGATATGLSRPGGIAADSTGRLWVADYFGNRVVRYDNAAAKGNGGAADAVIGQPDLQGDAGGVSQNQFDGPYDLAIDAQGHLWVADFGNSRILRFDNAALKPNGAAADGVLGQSNYTSEGGGDDASHTNRAIGIAISSGGDLFVSDSQNQRILRWDNAANKGNGSDADAVLGRLGLESGADHPADPGSLSDGIRGMCVDGTGRLWAADSSNERVLRWDVAASKANGASADGVIGQLNTSTTVSNSMDPAAGVYLPQGGLEDPVSGKFFIADLQRVLRFANRAALESGAAPEAFLGKNNGTDFEGDASSNGIRSALGLAMDSTGSLWVADRDANRVVSFPNAATAPTGAALGVVLGQPDFDTTTSGLKVNSLNGPRGLAIDSGGNLYVADYGNHRILRFNNVQNKTIGDSADAVIGQPDFVTASTATNAALLNNPSGICLDSQGRLWVADSGKDRIARYDLPMAVGPNDPPSGVLGGVATVSENGMHQPTAVAVTTSGRLWVCDSGFNRVLRFENAAAKPDAANADGVLGSPVLTDRYYESRTRSAFNRPEVLFLDAIGSLWVVDTSNSRLMKFLPDSSAVIESSGINGLGQFNLTFHGVPGTTYQLRSSTDLKVWDFEQAYSLADSLPHSFVSLKSGPRRFFRLEEP